MPKPPKAPEVAIVGAGLMGRWHLFTARNLGARVVAVVDPEIGAARALAARAPGARAISDAASLLERPPFAAHVCTPTDQHFDVAHRLVAAGSHVFVEKPICRQPDEARALTLAARRAGVLVCPVHQYAFQRGVERAMRWLPALGAVRRIRFSICSAGAERLPVARRAAVVAEILPHPISLLQRLVPTLRAAELAWCVTADPKGEYFAHAAAGGLIVAISISLNARPTCFLTNIDADGGRIDIDGFHGFATLTRGGASRARKIAVPLESSSKTLATAALNLGRRLVEREPAYPGLANLMRQFFLAAGSGGVRPAPISAEEIVEGAVAWSRLRAEAGLAGAGR